jgi:uncharacterized Zn finger protein
MAQLTFTEALIRQHASAESLRRGEEYYRGGAVVSLARRGSVLEAEVEGSEPLPYRVRLAFDDGHVSEATCTCPYDWGGWCKHIVAVALAQAREPEAVEARPSVEELVADLDRDQLRALVVKLAEANPLLGDAIERALVLVQVGQGRTPSPSAPASQPRRTAVDVKPFRRQVRAALHGLDRMSSSEAYWQVGAVVSEVRGVLDEAWAFVKAGDGASALAILDGITEEYVDGWEMLDDSDGEASGFFEDLGPAWAEALLTADLTPAERRTWAAKLEAWAEEISDYGVEDAFDAAIGAAEQGWDYPPLQRVLNGDVSELGAWEGEPPDYADDLAVARLNVLERQGRLEECLRLARAEGQTTRYATLLVRLGRASEALEYGLGYLASTDEAWSLAQALREAGEDRMALRIAEHGLGLDGPKARLAGWLADLAEALGETEPALAAANIAFHEQPDLAAYLRVKELAGERWPEHRDELLARLRRRKTYSPRGPVEVFLHEALLDDAISAVEGTWDYRLLEEVAGAAIPSHPDWVIRTGREQAETIMEEARAQAYHHAADWLAKAREAYRVAGREDEWRAYLAEQIARHQRKYKLRPMLEALRR